MNENQTPTPSSFSPSPRKHTFLIVLTILLFAAGAFATWYFLNPAPEPEFKNIVVKDELSDWKTYRNLEYGFEFKYPENLRINTESEKLPILLNLDNNKTLSVSVRSEPYKKDMLRWFDEVSKQADPSPKEVVPAVIDKEPAIKALFDYPGGSSHTIFVQKNKQIFEINYFDEQESNAIYNQILSTFKFISTSTKDVLPPDPGEAGKATLEGIDSDKDGVRDDVQRYIALTYPQSVKVRAALVQMAKAAQRFIIQFNNKAASVENMKSFISGMDCLEYISGLDNEITMRKLLRAELLNTQARTNAWLEADSHNSGQVGTPKFMPESLKAECEFDPDSLAN